MKWTGEVDVEPVDVEFLRSAFSRFLAAAGELKTDGDLLLHPETGLPTDNLRVDSGVHLRPGVVYESISTSPGLGATSRALVSLEANTDQLMRLSGVDEEMAWHLEVERPGKARKVTGGARLDAGPGRWFGGEVTFDVSADLDRCCSLGRRARDVADLTVEHRRFRVDVGLTASLVDDRVVLEVRGAGRGRGVMRPAVALALLVFGRRIKKMLAEGLVDLDKNLDELRHEIEASQTPDDLAREMLHSMFQDPSESTTTA